MLDYSVIGTGIRIAKNPYIRPKGYPSDENHPVFPARNKTESRTPLINPTCLLS
jgi:hypothetical protein